MRFVFSRFLIVKFLLLNELVVVENISIFQICLYVGGVSRNVKLLAKAFENSIKRDIFFLHFLVVAAALLSFPRANEVCHNFEDFIHPS